MLDLIRSISAIAVLLSHARVMLLESMSGHLTNPGIRIFYMLSSYGHSAVMIFFVLSGYLVGGSVIRSSKENRWSWRSYLLARGARLYVVLIPALLLTWLLDYGEFLLTHGVVGNNDTGRAVIDSAAIHANSTLPIFLGNLFFCQTTLVPALGSNTALWSLANEFWYYMVFPLLFLIFNSRMALMKRVVHALVLTVMLFFIRSKVDECLLAWLAGALVAMMKPIDKSSFQKSWVGLLCGLVFAGVLLAVGVGRLHSDGRERLYVAAAFVPLLIWILQKDKPFTYEALGKVIRGLAGCSYTLYAIHLPIVALLRAKFSYEKPMAATVSNCLLVLVFCLAIVAIAWIASLFTEAKTDRFRGFLSRVLPGKTRAVQ